MEIFIKEVDPSNITVSEYNERIEEVENDSDLSLEASISEVGVIEPPKVRKIGSDEYKYEVVVGQRRVRAAQSEEIDSIPVIVGEWDDQEALTMSISENVEGFKKKVSPTDRGEALLTLWELMGGDSEERPSHTALAEELAVPRPTVSQWLETVKDRWRGSRTTEEEIESDGSVVEQQKKETLADKLGERKMADIRRATDTQEESDRVARRVYDEGLTQEGVKDLRGLLEDGKTLDESVEDLKSDGRKYQTFDDVLNNDDNEGEEDEVEEVSDPTDVTEDTEDTIPHQIETVETVDVSIAGEIEFTVELPEETYDRAESYASNFGYDSVEDLLISETIPQFFQSDDGKETLIELLDEKAKARGY